MSVEEEIMNNLSCILNRAIRRKYDKADNPTIAFMKDFFAYCQSNNAYISYDAPHLIRKIIIWLDNDYPDYNEKKLNLGEIYLLCTFFDFDGESFILGLE